MADICYVRGCGGTSYDDCSKCKRPTCKTHGDEVGDEFQCWNCIDEESENT